MSDIYIVYAREDRSIAEELHRLLSDQWDTWWDDDIVGEFHKEIEVAIPKTQCIVPLFSKYSREKATVIDELRLGKTHNKKIIPLELDASDPPYSFGTYSRINMRDWKGEVSHPGLRLLLKRISKIVLPKSKPSRPKKIACGRIPLPSVFLSVSSYNTKILPSDAVKILHTFRVPSILISAYDLMSDHDDSQTLTKELERYKKKGGFVLIDSGNYEASRLNDESWSEKDLGEVLTRTPHDWAFCFDNMNPSKGHKVAMKEVVESTLRDQNISPATVLPIIHAPKLKNGDYMLKHVPQIVREVSEKLEPPLIAIPERELGAGLIARAKMVRDIREELNKLPYYQPIHLLGTGNPWAIAVLAAAGADTFDGLEWCRYTIDTDLDGINHFHLFDLFESVNNKKIGFSAIVASHNLEYFASFSKIMHDMFTQNKVESFVQGVLSKKAFPKLKEHFSELFE